MMIAEPMTDAPHHLVGKGAPVRPPIQVEFAPLQRIPGLKHNKKKKNSRVNTIHERKGDIRSSCCCCLPLSV